MPQEQKVVGYEGIYRKREKSGVLTELKLLLFFLKNISTIRQKQNIEDN
jgi:hypothetical protein